MELNFRPTIKQARALKALNDDISKYVLFGGGAGGGKSWFGCEWLLQMCLAFPGTKWFIGREKLTTLMGSTYITFIKVCKFHKIPQTLWKLNGQYHYIEFVNGSRIDLLDLKRNPSDPLYEDMGSSEYTGGWIEEAGEVHFDAFDTLKSRIGRHMNKEYGIKSKMLITCNPKKNWLYIDVYKPWKNGNLNPKWVFIQSLYKDNPHTAAEYEENLGEIKNKSKVARLKFGDWEYDDDPAIMFDFDKIADMFTNKVDKGAKFLTIDVAGAGKDKTVLTYWEGLHIYKIETMPNISNEELITRLERENISRSNCLIDNDGVGFGLVKDTPGVKGFVNGSSPIKTKSDKLKNMQNYTNLKSQCWFLLAEYVNNGLIGCYPEIPTDIKALLVEDLEVMKEKDIDKDSKKSVITKEMIKDILGRSPDVGDTLMMRMYFEINKKSFSFRSG